ncbi:MAG: GNAT family N-acetyltransferase [Lachnospiraceae bacterium]|nr:GNAT family N-acetyltransferase [Lachnospiraceae bacterium]
MAIETEVYVEDMRGEYDNILARFRKYPEMFFIAYDEDHVVGYFCFFPICQKLYDQIMEGLFRDDDITPAEIVPIEEARHMYILSVAILKEYQDTGIADEMMRRFEEVISRHHIQNVLASTVTEDGEKYAIRYGYRMFCDRLEQAGYRIYVKEFDYAEE